MNANDIWDIAGYMLVALGVSIAVGLFESAARHHRAERVKRLIARVNGWECR